MNKMLRMVVLSNLIIQLFCASTVFSKISFGSKDSTLRFNGGSFFHVGSTALDISRGTLDRDVDAEVSGNPFTISQGCLTIDESNSQIFMNGTYDPTGQDFLQLKGGDRLRVEPGYINEVTVNVEGMDNRLEGQPRFENEINFIGGPTELEIGIQSVLNQNINLNGGTLTLIDNLHLADDIFITGSGCIDLNDRRLELAGSYSTAWLTALKFLNATDLVLNGPVDLNATWTFDGVNHINGNGNTLDLSTGALEVTAGSTLFLTDICLTGFNSSSFVFGDAASTIRMKNVTVILVDDVTTPLGTIQIDGNTTFILYERNWVFNGAGALNVQENLWLDVCRFNVDPETFVPGTIFAPLRLFENNVLLEDNFDNNVLGSNLIVGPNGSIKEITDKQEGKDPAEEILLGGNVNVDITLRRDVGVPCDKVINITGNITIDACGSCITFNNRFEPQFIVQPGVTVTLRNISLCRINRNTFQMGENSQINIGENVCWELADDIVWDEGFIRVLNGPEGFNVWKILGCCGRRKFILNPANELETELVALRTNSILLQEVEFHGLRFVTFDGPGGASIVLSGQACVGIDQDTAMNFDIEGVGNELILMQDGLTLSGTIVWSGVCLKNLLGIRFALCEPVVDKAGVKVGNKLLILEGDPTIFLTSDTTLAGLIFRDANVSVRCGNSNAWVIDEKSLLEAQDLEVLGFPAKVQSAVFQLTAKEIDGEGLDPSFTRSMRSKITRSNVPKTAFQMLRERENLQRAKPGSKAVVKPKPRPSNSLRPRRKKKGRGTREINDIIDDTVDELMQNNEAVYRVGNHLLTEAQYRDITRALQLPAGGFDLELHLLGLTIRYTRAIAENYAFYDAFIRNFFNEEVLPFNILLDNTTITQAVDKDVTLKSDTHIINVQGIDNKIRVTKNWTFEPGTLNFADGSQLTFEFIPIDCEVPVLRFDDNFQMILEKNNGVSFCGHGKVVLGDGVVIELKGDRAELPDRARARKSSKSKKQKRGKKRANELEEQPKALGDIIARSCLIFKDKALLTVDDNGTAKIKGIGNLEVNAASVIGGPSAVLEIGCDVADDINFLVCNTGEIRSEADSRISIGEGTSEFIFERNGKLIIFDGLFEINAKTSAIARGCVRKIWFLGDSSIFVRDDGRLRFGQNKVQSISMVVEKPFDLRIEPVQVNGTGCIEYLSANEDKSFSGRVSIPTETSFSNDEAVFADFSEFLICTQNLTALDSQDKTQNCGFTFTDCDGQASVRTSLGITVPLLDGDIVTRAIIGNIDSRDKCFILGNDTSGDSFVIDEDGNRSAALPAGLVVSS